MGSLVQSEAVRGSPIQFLTMQGCLWQFVAVQDSLSAAQGIFE